MKQMKNSFNLLSRLSDIFLLLVIILIIFLVFLAVIGVYFIYTTGHIIYFIGFSLLISLAVILYLYIKQKKRKKLLENEVIIEVSPQCAQFDDEVREKIYNRIDKKIEEGLEWQDFQSYSLEIVSLIAFHYNPKEEENELAFSIPELLLALEVISCKYREIIIKYIPSSVSRVHLSSLKKLSSYAEKIEIFRHAYNAYRVVRIVTISGILSEIQNQVNSKILNNESITVQDKIMRALLKELSSVSIDLYRGHFKVKDSELSESKTSVEDKNNQADTVEPLRVTVVGQINAGKSSVINAITEKMVAEVSILPSTDNITVHDCNIDGIDAIKFIDLPGLDGSVETEKLIIDQMTESDLICWVLKADSPRKLDSQLRTQFDEFYTKDENLKRKKPSILVLVNQVDNLQPTEKWNPPYDITDCKSSDKKACIIRDVVKFNQEILQLDNILPLSLNPNLKFYNLEAVKEYLQTAYTNGINTQLNRRRIEDVNDGFVKSAKKLVKGTSKLFFELK